MYTLRGRNWKCPRVFGELDSLDFINGSHGSDFGYREIDRNLLNPGIHSQNLNTFIFTKGISWCQMQGDLIFKIQVWQQYWYGENSNKLQNVIIETIVGKCYITIVMYKVVETNARKNNSDLQIRFLLKFSLHTNSVLQMSKYFSITLYVSNLEFFAFFFPISK